MVISIPPTTRLRHEHTRYICVIKTLNIDMNPLQYLYVSLGGASQTDCY